MGNLLSNPDQLAASRLDKKIHIRNARDYYAGQRVYKLLLLGVGESGKSTILKQIRQLYGSKYSTKDLHEYTPRVYENIIEQFAAVLGARQDLSIQLSDESLAGKFEKTFARNSVIDIEAAKLLQALYADERFQQVYANRATFQVLENIEYFMKPEVLTRISTETTKKTFIPTFEDLLQTRVRTTGITQEPFRLYDVNFMLFDVGGQRSERRKWLNCFDNVMTVLYVASISEFDQVLFEDARTERLSEALKVWKDIVNRPAFQDIGFVLFLNKLDLFKKKLETINFKIPGKNGRNQNYFGSEPLTCVSTPHLFTQAVESCATFMKEKFLDCVEQRSGYGVVATHLVTAVDSQIVDAVFSNARTQIFRGNLFNNGFLI